MKDNNNNNNQVYELMIPSSNSPPSDSDISATKEQDRFLPIANVSRIMKRSLPANAKISKEAKETVQECVSEFISFVTGEASDKCQREKRKTINGDDLLWAMTTLGFDNYVLPLKAYLSKYRESDIIGEKSGDVRQLEQPMALPLHEQGGHGGMMEPDLDMHPHPIEIHGLQWCP